MSSSASNLNMSNASDNFTPVPVAALPRVRRTFGVHPNYLDVMCCLVLVFLLTSLLADTSKHIQEQNLPPVTLPELPADGTQSSASSAPPFVVTVKPGPQYLAGNRLVGLTELGKAIQATHPREVEIRGDEASQYGHVMDAMRVCREAGISQVALTYQVKE